MSFGGGSSNPQPQQVTSTSTTSELPRYLQRYVEETSDRARGLSQVPYQPYGGQRVAGFSPETEQSFGAVQGLAAAGSPETNLAANTALGLSGYQAGDVGTTSWTDADVAAYMNPYQEQVFDVQQARILKRFRQQQNERDAAYVQAGAFGGSRRHVSDEIARDEMNEALEVAEAEGLERAFTNAQNIFTSDEQRELQAQELRERVGVDAANVRAAGAEGLARFGDLRQTQGLRLAGAVGDIGTQRRELAQNNLDVAYGNFVSQRDSPRERLNFFNSIMRGQPVTAQSDVVTTQPSPSIYSQIAGAGLAATGLYGALS